MSETKENIEVKNQKALLSSLRNDIIEASTALSQIYDELKSVKKQLEDAELQLEADRASSLCVIELCDAQRADAQHKMQDADKYVERVQGQIKVLKEQKKESMTELKRLNEWVLTAEEKNKNLTKENADLEAGIAEKKGLVTDLEDLRTQKKEASDEYRIILVDTKLAKDEAEAKMAQADQKMKEAEEMVVEARKRAEEAKQAESDAKIRANKVNADLEVCIQRVEKHYKKAFPNLRMKVST